MKNGFDANYYMTDGHPDGGHTCGTGFTIVWQRGPLTLEDGTLGAPNGAFVEDIIDAAKHWLEYQQTTDFACQENAVAIISLNDALLALESRAQRRKRENRLGTHIKE